MRAPLLAWADLGLSRGLKCIFRVPRSQWSPGYRLLCVAPGHRPPDRAHRFDGGMAYGGRTTGLKKAERPVIGKETVLRFPCSRDGGYGRIFLHVKNRLTLRGPAKRVFSACANRASDCALASSAPPYRIRINS